MRFEHRIRSLHVLETGVLPLPATVASELFPALPSNPAHAEKPSHHAVHPYHISEKICSSNYYNGLRDAGLTMYLKQNINQTVYTLGTEPVDLILWSNLVITKDHPWVLPRRGTKFCSPPSMILAEEKLIADELSAFKKQVCGLRTCHYRSKNQVIHQLEVKYLTSRSPKHLSKTAGQKMSIAEMADRVATVDSYFVPRNLVLSVAPVITGISKTVCKLQGNVL
ncbi:hypothetical protein C8R45DRAFT_934692 [Mycena sanguinolenta]|nr:hypothetical protein C8R45DRAFT_934692 [Mycena sanguinolenta]